MAHQYVDEVLRVSGAPPHGELFARACRTLRCDPAPSAASERLPGLAASAAEEDRILRRIKDLLALAGSPNVHEAASAMRMAHKYLLRYNLDLQQVDGRSAQYGTRYLGRSSGRIQEYQYTLSTILQEHFFVLAIWTYSYDPRRNVPGRILQISGSRENLEMAAYVYHFVLRVAESLWQEHERERDPGGGTRLQYFAGLLRGFEEKLRGEQQTLAADHGLVWLGDDELIKYFRHQHPRTRLVSSTGVRRSGDFRAGMRDGRRIVIRRALEDTGLDRGRRLDGPRS
jgi:hypothetical protein